MSVKWVIFPDLYRGSIRRRLCTSKYWPTCVFSCLKWQISRTKWADRRAGSHRLSTKQQTAQLKWKIQHSSVILYYCYVFGLFFLQDIKSKIRPKVKVNGLKTTETGGFSRLQVQSGVKAVKQHDGDDNSDVGRLSSGMQRLNDTAIKNRLRRQLDQLGVQLNLTMCSDILQKSVHTHSSVKNGVKNKRLNHNSSKLMKRLKKGS